MRIKETFTLIRNIKQLATPIADGKKSLKGKDMDNLLIVENAAIAVQGNTIEWIGRDSDIPDYYKSGGEIIDAKNSVALPGFVDMHTHMVFGATREEEFAMRCSGATYLDIAARGGGINNTVNSTRDADKKILRKKATRYLDRMLHHGTTTVEIKSGYGLTEKDEIKMLDVINILEQDHLIDVIPTFLGAHAIPPEYQENREKYIEIVCNKMIPYVARKKLSMFCDVFCEEGFFTLDESRKILNRGREHGLIPKIHADELSPMGGAELAVGTKAISADHLEHISNNAIEMFGKSDIIAGLLPGVSFFLGHDYAPARELIDNGAAVAIATDFNPGSCMSYSMPLMMTISCTQMNMTIEEVITASTLNAAASLNISKQTGSIEKGKQADILFFNASNYKYIPYHFGENHLAAVMKNGTWLDMR